ncbi:MAG: histidine ammonia-lyase, partial [Sphingobacteriales bacterium]
MGTFLYGSGHLTVSSAIAVAAGTVEGVLDEDTRKRVLQSQREVEQIAAEERTVYGINTGFGILANTKISEEDTRILQHKIL